MSKKESFDDLELEEIQGDIRQKSKSKIIIEEKKEVTEEEQEWTRCVDKLTEYTSQAWIAIPKEERLAVYDIKTCSDEDFFAWLCYIWPGCKRMNHSAKDYDNENARINALINIVDLHNRMKFPKTDFSK